MGITSDALHLRDYQPRAYCNTPPSARTWSQSKAGPIVVPGNVEKFPILSLIYVNGVAGGI
eukprot:1082890-Pyramimonas_sp.AAC.1